MDTSTSTNTATATTDAPDSQPHAAAAGVVPPEAADESTPAPAPGLEAGASAPLVETSTPSDSKASEMENPDATTESATVATGATDGATAAASASAVVTTKSPELTAVPDANASAENGDGDSEGISTVAEAKSELVEDNGKAETGTQSVVEAVEHAEPLSGNSELSKTTQASDDIKDTDCTATLSSMLEQMSRMRDTLQTLLSGMAPSDAERHTAQLHQLQDALTSCAEKLPRPADSEVTDLVDVADPADTDTHTHTTPKSGIKTPHRPLNYLEQLPEGPLEAILRFFSSRPRAADWGKHISARDAEALLLLDGPLGDAARRRFRDIELNSGTGSSSSRLGEVLLSMREAPERLNTVLERTGSALTKLAYVGDRDENSPPHLTAWMQPFTVHCSSVKHLTLHRVHTSYFDSLLRSCGSQLESLTLDSNTSTRAHLYLVGRHCAGLLKLVMCPGLSIPENLWEKLGPTLTELEMSPATKPPGPKIMLKYIQEHCRAITRFALSKDSAPPELIDLLKSYGDQLLFAKANFGFLPFPTVTSLANACPNAVFELSGPMKPDIVMGLQYRVHTLKFSKPLLDPVPPAFFEECKHVRVLSVQMPDSDTAWLITSLLRDPKPSLAEVSITGTQDNPAEILDALAKKTTKLTKLKLCSKSLPVDDLEPVLKVNPGLLKLTLKARTVDLRTVRQVLRVCAQCKELRELRISKVSSPAPPPRPPVPETVASATAFEIARTADACMPFRRRNAYVQISSVDYVF